MNGFASRLAPVPLETVAGTALTTSYQVIGAAMSNPIRILQINNLSNQSLVISWDGTNDHMAIGASQLMQLDVSANKETSNMLEIPQGTQFFVRSPGGAGTGSVYLAAYYAY